MTSPAASGSPIEADTILSMADDPVVVVVVVIVVVVVVVVVVELPALE